MCYIAIQATAEVIQMAGLPTFGERALSCDWFRFSLCLGLGVGLGLLCGLGVGVGFGCAV